MVLLPLLAVLAAVVEAVVEKELLGANLTYSVDFFKLKYSDVFETYFVLLLSTLTIRNWEWLLPRPFL